MNEFNFNSFDNSKQTINYCEVDKCKAVIKLKQVLNEIKEILLKTPTDSQEHCVNTKSVILQKISEVEK